MSGGGEVGYEAGLSLFPAKFPHSPILHYVCRSLLTENNDNATAVGLCTV